MAESVNGEAFARGFNAARMVKRNPVREVRTDGEFFYKLDRRGGRGLRREFAAARRLTAHRVPVVEHLWCGQTPAGFLLVTRALTDSTTVREYARRHVPDAEFCRSFAEFIRDFLATGLDHRDLHVGNILYHPATRSFVLVDVCAVRRWRWRRLPYDICRAPLELRLHLGKRELCAMLAIEGIADPERFLERALRIEAAALRRAWPKREKQILSGYPKFTRESGALLVSAEATEDELRSLEWRPGGAEEFCDSFYRDLAELPHRRILAFDRGNGMLGYESNPFPSPLSPDELSYREQLFARI